MTSRSQSPRATAQLAAGRTELRLTLLGEFSIWLGQRPVPEAAFARRKALSLLKLLALQPGYQLHREQVMEHLWPELTPDSAATQLYKAIHQARKALAVAGPPEPPDALLHLRGDVLGLSAPGGVSTDLAEFESQARQALTTRDLDPLHRAAGRYTGDLLPGDLYEPWVAERRETLRERYIDLLVELGEAYLEAGAVADAAEALRQAVARDATREDAQRGLMLAYARQGSRARALRQFRICTEAVARELGTDVSTETAALYHDILEERVQRAGLPGSGPATDLAMLPPLIGRRTELRVIGALLDRLARGRGAVLGVEGDAGIGKTRLAQEIQRLGWQRHWHVLFGTAHEQEGQMPYMPFVEALRGTLWHDPTGAELIPAELAVAIPEISASVLVSLPDRLAAQRALFAGVARFLAARARTAPIILVLDDLHAVDAGSLKLFSYLARETATLPLLLVGGWRPHEPGAAPALAETIASLERVQILQRLHLTALTAEEHRALVSQALGAGDVNPQLAAALYRLSEGNALFAREMARQLAADGGIVQVEGAWRFAGDPDPAGSLAITASAIPPSLHALARHRMASLSPAAGQLLQLAAVAGRDIPLSLLERGMKGGEEGGSLLDLVDELLAAGVLTEVGLTFRFPHPLLREAVYEQLSQARRAMLHGVVAGVLETLQADAPGSTPVEAIAFHYRQAGDTRRAVHYLLQAGARAEAVYDHDGALSRYGEALALLQRSQHRDRAPLLAEVHERTGDTHRAIGDVARAHEQYLQAVEALAGQEAEAPFERGRRFNLYRKIAVGAILNVDMPVAAEHLALARALGGADAADEARLLIADALYAWYGHQYDMALQHASRALVIAERVGARAEISQAYEMLAIAHLPLGHWEEGLRCELRWQTSGWSLDTMVAVDAHLCLYLHAFQGEESLQHTRRFIETLARQSATAGNQHCLAVCHFVLGNLALHQGLPAAAAENFARALALHEQIGSQAGVAYTLAQQVELLTAAGVYAPAARLIERGIEAASRASLRDHSLRQLYAAGIRNRSQAGNAGGATALIEAATTHAATCPPCAVCEVEICEALATFHLMAGEPDEAWRCIERARQLSGYAQSRPGRARLARVRGQIHAARDETAEAVRCLLEAADLFGAAGDHYDLALTLRALAALEDGRDRTDAHRQAEVILARYVAPSLAAALARA